MMNQTNSNTAPGYKASCREWLTGTHFHSILLMACLLVAFGLRLFQLGTDSLWEDEIFSATQASLPVPDLLRWTAGDIHPPAYYLLVGQIANWMGWTRLEPSTLTDWLWRFPSALVGTMAVAVAYRLGRLWFGRWVALLGAVLLAASPVAIQYSQEARMHQLFLLGTVASTYALARAMAANTSTKPNPAWGWWLGYGLLTALNLYTVYLAFVVLLAQAAWVVVSNFDRHPSEPIPTGRFFDRFARWVLARKGFVVSVALAMALYLPWWPTLLGIFGQQMAVQPLQTGQTDLVGSPLDFGVKAVYSLGPAANWTAWLLLALWAAGIIDTGRKRPALAFFGTLCLLLPLALPFVFRDPRALHMRYAFLLPVYLLFVARGAFGLAAFLSGLFPRPAKAGRRGLARGTALGLALAALVLLSVSLIPLPAYYRQSKPDWRGAASYLTQSTAPGDVIVTGPLFDVRRYLDYYYQGPAELVTPAVLISTLPDRVDSMRISGGRVWALTHFQPRPLAALKFVRFPGLTVSEPTIAVYEADVLTQAMIAIMQKAVEDAPGWAEEMSSQGLMEPDPLVSRAAAYLFLGESYQAAGRLSEAIGAYQAMVIDHPQDAGAYVVLAEAYHQAGQDQESATTYRRAVSLNADWQGSQSSQAGALMDDGRWAEAVEIYQELVHGN